MEAKTQFLCAIVIVLGLLSQGSCLCTLANIKIEQDTTGRTVGGKQEWKVTITNDCACTQQDLKLDCDGFQTSEKPDPKYVTVAGALCLVSDQDQPIIRPFSSINFTYAWDNAFTFTPITTQFNCS